MNQCDGCKANLKLDTWFGGDIHIDENGGTVMVCQKDRYEEDTIDRKSLEIKAGDIVRADKGYSLLFVCKINNNGTLECTEERFSEITFSIPPSAVVEHWVPSEEL